MYYLPPYNVTFSHSGHCERKVILVKKMTAMGYTLQFYYVPRPRGCKNHTTKNEKNFPSASAGGQNFLIFLHKT